MALISTFYLLVSVLVGVVRKRTLRESRENFDCDRYRVNFEEFSWRTNQIIQMCSNVLKGTALSAFFEPRGWAHRDLITSTHPPHLYFDESLETFFLPLLNSTRIMLGDHPFQSSSFKGRNIY